MERAKFTKYHIWVRESAGEGDPPKSYEIGITDYAQEKLKTIMFVTLPETDETVVAGRKFGDVESIKTVTDLIAPVSGKVLSVNEDILDFPDRMNETPYDSWLIKVSLDEASAQVFDSSSFMDLDSYKEYVNTL